MLKWSLNPDESQRNLPLTTILPWSFVLTRNAIHHILPSTHHLRRRAPQITERPRVACPTSNSTSVASAQGSMDETRNDGSYCAPSPLNLGNGAGALELIEESGDYQAGWLHGIRGSPYLHSERHQAWSPGASGHKARGVASAMHGVLAVTRMWDYSVV